MDAQSMSRENKPLTSIRGFAAIWVVALHFVPSSKGIVANLAYAGYTAVDLFFILSGLILACVYADLARGTAGLFWVKRVCRIYPLHIVSTVILVALMVQVDPSLIRQYPGPILDALLLVHPFVDMPLAMPGNPPSWSIGIEMVCYLIFPLLIALYRSPASRLLHIAILAALLAAEFAVQIEDGTAIHGEWAMLRGLVGFLIGLSLWRLGRGVEIDASRLSLCECASVAAMLLAALIGSPEVIPLFAALLLFCLMFDAGVVARFLRRPICLWLGHISFSIYLLHFVIVYAAIQYFPARAMPIHGGLGRTLWELGLIGALLGLSTLTYHTIELPGRRIPALIAGWKARRLRAQGGQAMPAS